MARHLAEAGRELLLSDKLRANIATAGYPHRKQRPPGSNWGGFGEDDELGRINLLTREKVLQGIAEVEHGISLSLPLDLSGGLASPVSRASRDTPSTPEAETSCRPCGSGQME